MLTTLPRSTLHVALYLPSSDIEHWPTTVPRSVYKPSTAFSRLYSRLAMETVPTLADIMLDFLLIEIRYEKKTQISKALQKYFRILLKNYASEIKLLKGYTSLLHISWFRARVEKKIDKRLTGLDSYFSSKVCRWICQEFSCLQ